MEEVKITRKLLDNYKKLKRELPFLEYELDELWETDKGLGNSVILNGKAGSKKPETVVGFDYEKYNRRKRLLLGRKDRWQLLRNGLTISQTVRPDVCSKCFTGMG